MSDFEYCKLCGRTVALTRERDETKPTVEELMTEIERLWDFINRRGLRQEFSAWAEQREQLESEGHAQ